MNLISVFDMRIEQALYAMRDPYLVQFFIWVSEFGSFFDVILGLTLITAILLAYRKRWALVAGLFTSVFGSFTFAYALKEIVARPRPPAPLYAYLETTYSFPSGHAVFSVAFYFFILWLVLATLPSIWRYAATTAVAVLTLAVGFSRLYHGVHYPSDVLAGYIIGGFFVLLGIKVAKYLERNTISAL